MSTAFGIADTLVTWKRQTAELLLDVDISASPATIALTYQPLAGLGNVISLKPAGSPTGSAVVSGTVSGLSSTETLTWSGTSVFRVTKKLFTAISNINASGLTGGTTMTVRARGTDGQPHHSLFVVKGPGHPVKLSDASRRGWPGEREGSSAIGTHRFLVQYEEVWRPRKGDVVITDRHGEEFLIVGRPTEPGGMFPYEWVCNAVRREDSQGT